MYLLSRISLGYLLSWQHIQLLHKKIVMFQNAVPVIYLNISLPVIQLKHCIPCLYVYAYLFLQNTKRAFRERGYWWSGHIICERVGHIYIYTHKSQNTCSLMIPPLFGKQEVGIWRVQKRFPRYGVPIWSLWPNIRFLPSVVAEKNVTKNVHICSMCIKTN
jgi:hypothetical protein